LNGLLADPAVQVVTIGTPSGAHLEPAVAAARAGKHVIVEKPLEITLKRCDAMIEACRQAGVTLATIFPSRFHESSQVLKKAVDKGRFGRLTMGDAYVKWYRTQQYYDSGAWRGTWALDGGGALMNQAIHSVDLLTWIMGPVVEITAHTATLAHERIEVEDVAVATLRFASGALGVIEASTAAYPGFLKRIEIHGSEGSAVLEEEDITKWDFAKTTRQDEELRARMAGKTKTGGGAADPAAIGHHGHTAMFKDVLKAIQKGTSPLVDGGEGRRSVEIILGIYKSAETGRAVSLPLTGDPVLKARKPAK
jgi:predicted dehydrogenase